MKIRDAVNLSAIVALTLAFHAGTARAASPPAGSATLESVTFEIRPDEITARIATSVPVPRYLCEFGPSGDPVLTFAEVASRLEGQYEPPVAFLGAVRVEAPAAGARGQAVLRFRTRSAN